MADGAVIRVAVAPDLEQARRAGRNRKITRALLAITVSMPLLVSAIALLMYPGNERANQLALALQASGVTVTADAAEARVVGKHEPEARATFNVDGTPVTAPLVAAGPSLAGSAREWAPLPADSGYAPPLVVRYLPSDPQEAMAEKDVVFWARPGAANTGLLIAGLGLVPAGLALLGWFLGGRPAWWRYGDKYSPTCWYCAHFRDQHTGSAPCGTRGRWSRRRCVCPAWTTQRQHFIVTDDALFLWHGLRPVSIPRGDVVAVRGDSARLEWSSALVIETTTRKLTLSDIRGWPLAAIPTLQNWAGVGEHGTAQ
ncbi:hypothetical protein [Cellulomonas cellasea]|uniref:Uncharacterized protein n=1 Tax=Cellulomonas cellasea TaxID=43670 RepID=A0A7W4UKC8_9CELL|nr:hypothetical protein [Cellulomonas cellasea]MBB2925489.1 hypothetical protein [Cellulomonas cellasea]